MSRARARLALAAAACAAALAGAGCGGVRVRVVDASSGQAVASASVTVSVEGSVVSRAATGSGGGASVAPAAGGVLTVSARGYASWGEPLASPAPSSLRVELEPTWVDAFLEDKRAIGADAPSREFTAPERCPCDPPAR